jgi:hypothetical protein
MHGSPTVFPPQNLIPAAKLMTPNRVNGEVSKGQSTSQANTSAVIAEALRAMRNRSPEESLGLNGESGLMTSSLIAFAGIFLILLALTLVPYLLDKSFSSPPKQPNPTPANGTEVIVPSPATTAESPSSNPATAAKNPPDTSKGPSKKKDFPDHLGENGVKNANPKVNPLDKKEDDILKDFK